VISLLEENDSMGVPSTPTQKRRKKVIFQSPLNKPGFSRGKITDKKRNLDSSKKDKSRPNSSVKKKYKKDEHALVMAWRSRTSSPCPSSNSVKSSYSIASNLSFKEKKQLLNSGAVKHPSIFKM